MAIAHTIYNSASPYTIHSPDRRRGRRRGRHPFLSTSYPSRVEANPIRTVPSRDFTRYKAKEDHGDPDYSWVSPKVAGMMERWGYRFEDKEGLNCGKGRKTPLESYNPRGMEDYRGLGCNTTPDQSDMDSNPLARYDHSSVTSSFVSDISVGTLFELVSINMAPIGAE